MQQPDAWPAVVPPEVIPLAHSAEDRAAILNVVSDFAKRAGGIIVNSPESYEGASETLREVATLLKAVDERRSEEGKPLFEAKKAIDDAYKPAIDALKGARARLEGSRNDWKREQDRRAREEQEKLNRKAEQERQRLAKLAQQAEERGDFAKADQFTNKADAVVAPVVQPLAPKVAGVGTRTVWKYEVVDEAQLPREYLTPDHAAIAAYVKALGAKAVDRIPGVRVFADESTVVRSK